MKAIVNQKEELTGLCHNVSHSLGQFEQVNGYSAFILFSHSVFSNGCMGYE
jgi:hypothetical protein